MKGLVSSVVGAALLCACATGPEALRPKSAASPTTPADEVFYHVFNRSLRDSDGDGHGDLRGVVDSLDHLQRLGVTSILLTPLYPSHFYHNYFASDFEGIDPEYGTMADYSALVDAVHARGMKIYLDQEMQYVADDHQWWSDPAHADYILWDDRAKRIAEEGPFGLREAANFSGRTTGITTVDLKHPKVKAWFDRYYMSWVDPDGDGDFSDGVDGFRIDHMMDDLDDKGLLTDLFADFWRPLFDKLRAANPNVRFIAEQSDWGYGGDFLARGDADFVFAFPLREAIRSFDKGKIVAAIAGTAAATPPGKHQLIFVENHDMNRLASDPGMTPQRLRTAAALGILLKGTPMLYYGQEIGMLGSQNEAYKTDEKDIGVREAFEWEAKVEAPVHANWYARAGEAYWDEKYSRDDDGISVAEQEGDPGSLLSHYQRLLRLRREHPALTHGSQRVLDSASGLLVVERSLGDERLLIVSNLSAAAVDYRAEAADLLGGKGGRIEPYRTALFKG